MSRAKGGPASLAELIGKTDGKQLELKDLPKILGEKLPDIPTNRVGRIRLLRALKNRFGDGYRSIPGINNILKEFEREERITAIARLNQRVREERDA